MCLLGLSVRCHDNPGTAFLLFISVECGNYVLHQARHYCMHMNLWPCNGTVVGIHGSSMMQQSVERDAQPAVTRFLHRDRPADVGTRMRQVNILNSSRPIESWWRHQMETFSALLVLCAGNSPVTGEFPAQRPVTQSFDVFFNLRLNNRLSNQSWDWWSEKLSRLLWRHCNVTHICVSKLGHDWFR